MGINQACWFMQVIPVVMERQKDLEFEATLGCIARTCQKKNLRVGVGIIKLNSSVYNS
jgi:hypothetical protein